MFATRLAVFLSALAVTASATTITITNNCADAVDPGIYPAANGNVGGFALAAGASQSITLGSGYSGRIWGRTGCDANGTCSTGSCTGGVNCSAPAAAGPTLAQFTIDGYASLDFFNPTVGDGFNVPVTITPGTGCSTSAVSCTSSSGAGNDCGGTSTCPTGTSYTVSFC